ncbi:hypothetical protein V5O48_018818, partial [Marasmius crinis-equi]
MFQQLFVLALPLLVHCATFPDPNALWKGPKLNSSDALFAGLKQIQGVNHMLLYDGSEVGRTYSHHAIVENVNGRLWAAWSSAANDEDSMGQQVWVNYADRVNSNWTWNEPTIPGPSALLPNQTSVGDRNYTYWCDLNASLQELDFRIIQRALQPSALVQFNGDVYAIIEAVDRYCPGGVTHGSGRLAARYNATSGQLISKACWLTQTQYTNTSQYSQTPLGSTFCASDILNGLNTLLDKPDVLPFTNSLLINSAKFVGNDGSSSMTEVTRAVWNEQGQFWQRFWRDSTGSKTSFVHWTEYSADPAAKDWFPYKFNANGSNNIVPTNIPDSNTKSFYGKLPDGRTYLVTNLLYHPDTKERQPLCIAVASDGVHFDWAGVVRTNAST